MKKINGIISLLVLITLLAACTNTTDSASAKKPVNPENIQIRISTEYSTVKPDEAIILHVVTEAENVELTEITWNADDGDFSNQNDNSVTWQAPWTPGEYQLAVSATVAGENISTKKTITVAGVAQNLGVEIISTETTVPTGGKLSLGVEVHGPNSEAATIEWSEEGVHRGSFSTPGERQTTWNAPNQPSTNEITVLATVDGEVAKARINVETMNHLELDAISPRFISTSIGSTVELSVEASGYYAAEVETEWEFTHADVLDGNVQIDRHNQYTIAYRPLQESAINHEILITATTPSGVTQSETFTLEVGFCDEGDFTTAATPCLVGNVYQLQAIGASSDRLAGYYRLASNIDASETAEWNGGEGFIPIGGDPHAPQSSERFSGEFDGRGYEVSGLHINNPAREAVGLFSTIYGVVTDITIRDAYIVGNLFVGTLAGTQSAGEVSNVQVYGSDVRGSRAIGGLIGWVFRAVQPTRSVSVESSQVTAEIDIAGGMYGMVEEGEVQTAFVSSTEVYAKDRYAGGFVGGLDSSTIVQTGAVWDTDVETGGEVSGGFAGFLIEGAQIMDSYVFGLESKVSGVSKVGGFVGGNHGKIKNSYAVINVFGSEDAVGGFVGDMGGAQSGIDQAFSYGEVSGAGTNIGGFAGVVQPDASQKIQVALWSPENSGQTTSAAGTMLDSDADLIDFYVLDDHGFDISRQKRAWRIPLSDEEYSFVPDLRHNAR